MLGAPPDRRPDRRRRRPGRGPGPAGAARRSTSSHATVLALTGSQGKTGTKDFLAQLLAPRRRDDRDRRQPQQRDRRPTDRAPRHPRDPLPRPRDGRARRRPHRRAVRDRPAAGRRRAQRRHRPHRRVRLARGDRAGQGRDRRGAARRRHGRAERRRRPGRRDGATARSARVVTFGVAGDVALARRSSSTSSAGPSFELGYDGAWAPVRLLEAGAHQVPNAAAAAAMAAAAGVAVGRHRRAPSAAARSLSPWRMALHERADGLVVVNDAYNANPASMAAALDALAAIGERGRTPHGGRARRDARAGESSADAPRRGGRARGGAGRRRPGHRRRRRGGDRGRRATYAGMARRGGAHGGPRAGGGLAATQCRRPGRRPGQGVAGRRPRTRGRCPGSVADGGATEDQEGGNPSR